MPSEKVSKLAEHSASQLLERKAASWTRINERMARAQDEDRDLTTRETELSLRDRADLADLDAAIFERQELDRRQQDFEADAAADRERRERSERNGGAEGLALRNQQVFAEIAKMTAQGGRPASDRNPLAYTPQALDNIQRAIETRSWGRFRGDDTEVFERAALATTTYGAPRVWGSNVLDGPRLLHRAAGVPEQPSDAVLAQYPVLTLPSSTAGVGENVTLPEFAASTAGSTTLQRFGRFTDISTEGGVGTSSGAIVAQHQIGIAKDLDANLVALANTSAGSAVAFTADVPAAIRSAMAKVIDATAAPNASDLVVLVHPDNSALLQSVSPIGGQTIAEGFQNFSGALVYPSSAVPTGFMIVANLRAGARYFQAQGVMTTTDLAVKTGTLTLATSVIAGYGIGIVGACVKVDVVTP